MSGNSNQFVKETILCLVKISQKRSDVMKEEFSFLFKVIDQNLQEIKQRSSDLFRDNTLDIKNDDFGAQE